MIRDKFSSVSSPCRRWQLRHPEQWKRHCIKRNIVKKQRKAKARQETIFALGGKCSMCGFSDIRALQIDHVLGGGTQEHKSRNRTGFDFWYDKARIIDGFKTGRYQLLCANCNWIKRYDNKEARGPFKSCHY